MQQQETTASKVAGNLPTVLGLIGMFIIASLYWTSPGWDVAVTLRNAVTLSLPWPTAIVSLLLIRRHVRNLLKQEVAWPYDLTVVASAAIMVVIGLAFGIGNLTLKDLYNNISVIGTMAVISAISISIMSAMIRIYRARTWTMAFLIGLSILAFMTYSPLGEMIHPIIPRVGDFVQTYISGASDSAFWISTYIGAIALVTRMILLKEKLKPV
ncbi:MAG: hypothetical protein QXI32_03680 [Candidatus Bathyarchaeia archaeon]